MSFNEDNILLDVQMRAASTTNSNTNVIMSKMLLGQVTSHLRKSSREHQVVDIALFLVYDEISNGHLQLRTKTYHHQT
jgi:hypothetical protein